MHRHLEDVERKQDKFEIRQDEMAQNIIAIRSMMSQSMGGANPPFNPLEMQSPKTP